MLKRLSGVIFICGLLLTAFIFWAMWSSPDMNHIDRVDYVVALTPATIGWVIKYVFTGSAV